jgi:hypothetical protein
MNNRQIYHLYIAKSSLDRAEPYYDRATGSIRMAWTKMVMGTSRIDAIEKCLPQINKVLGGITDGTIKFVSVYAGTKGVAERLAPVQIDVATGQIRKHL